MRALRTTYRAAVAAIGCVLAAVALALGCASVGHADASEAGWTVTLDAGGQMTSDYAQQKASIDAALSGLLPGDSFALDVMLKNDNGARSSWYMTSKAIKTLEEASEASNGAYTYKLLYNGEVVYGSDTVGGDGPDGFMEISSATGEWFWLGYIDPGQTGHVRIEMSLDGETQDNSYMNTVGRLSVSFAAEFNDGHGARMVEEGQAAATPTTSVGMLQTGDVVALVAAAILAIAACAGAATHFARRKKLGKGSDSR